MVTDFIYVLHESKDNCPYSLVRYATTGMTEQLFVSKYQVNLPSEEELQQLVREEQERLSNS